MQIWRHPVAQFLATGLLTMVVLVLALGWLGQREATEEATRDARDITEVLGTSVAEPAIPVGLVEGRPAAADRFDREMRTRLLIGRVLRVKIWNENGQIVYSDKTQLMWEQFDLGEDEQAVLRDGGTNAEVSDLTAAENRFEVGQGKLLEVYTRIWAPTGEPLLFEAYFAYDDVTRRSESIESAFRPITLAGSVRSSLRSLRSLLVEIYPSDLRADGLAAALDDLVAPAAGLGIQTSVEVADTGDASGSAVRLVWRVAQEAVRNAVRHGRPDTLTVRVTNTDGWLALDVEDDGRGFDPLQLSENGHFGLRGLRDLIREVGGRLSVSSSPGQGTKVRLEVRSR